MRRALAVAAAAVVALTLAGCEPSKSGAPTSATDPRDGKVTIEWSNCMFGSCTYDWKVCIGPDLYVRIEGTTGGYDPVILHNDPACAPRKGAPS